MLEAIRRCRRPRPDPAHCSDTTLHILQATTGTTLMLFQGDGQNFMLTHPLEYRLNRTCKTITVPAGFVTDFASVPYFARGIINVLGRHSVPAIVHDYLYWMDVCKRKDADLILLEGMWEYGASCWEKLAVYAAVRAFGCCAWKQNAIDKAKGLFRVVPRHAWPNKPNVDWNAFRAEHINVPEGALSADELKTLREACRLPPL